VIVNAHPNLPNVAKAIELLKALDEHGRHNVVALDPNEQQGPIGRTFEPGQWDAIADWLRAHLDYNLYFSRNEPREGAPHGKLSEADIVAVRALGIDLDIAGGTPEEIEAQRVELHDTVERIVNGRAPPTVMIETGNGAQGLWLLPEKVAVDKVSGPNAKALGLGMRKAMGGDSIANLDRIMRLPGLMNHSSVKKRALGKTGGMTKVIYADRRQANKAVRLDIDALGAVYGFISSAEITDSAVAAVADQIDLAQAREGVSAELQARLDAAPIVKGVLSGETPPRDTSGSGWRAALAGNMARAGFTLQDYAATVLGWEPGQPKQGDLDLRTLARDWARVGETAATAAAAETHLSEVSEADIDVSAWNEQRVKQREDEIEAKLEAKTDIVWEDPADWKDVEIPERVFYVDSLVPQGGSTLVTGIGGVGKSNLVLQMLVCIALGRPFLGLATRQAKVCAFFCEDDRNEIGRRLQRVCADLDIDLEDLRGRMIWTSRIGELNTLAEFEAKNGGAMRLSKLHGKLLKAAVDFGAEVVALDTIADVFSGNEIDRQQVSAFVKRCAGSFVDRCGACILLGHPSKSGSAEGGDMTSGSTAWKGSVRSHLALGYDGDDEDAQKSPFRKLSNLKANYAGTLGAMKLLFSGRAFSVFSVAKAPNSDAPTLATPRVPITSTVLEGAIAEAVARADIDGVILAAAAQSPHYIVSALKAREKDALRPFKAAEVAAAVKAMVLAGTLIEVSAKSARRHPIKAYALRPVSDEAAARFFTAEEDHSDSLSDGENEPGLFD
jgi:RecA-family ATPase